MLVEVKHAFALYEKMEGTIKEKYRCIGVSNRKKDLARLAVKSVETYLMDSDIPDISRKDFIFELQKKTREEVCINLDDKLSMSYVMVDIDIPNMMGIREAIKEDNDVDIRG